MLILLCDVTLSCELSYGIIPGELYMTTLAKHQIDVYDSAWIWQLPYRLPQNYAEKVWEEI